MDAVEQARRDVGAFNQKSSGALGYPRGLAWTSVARQERGEFVGGRARAGRTRQWAETIASWPDVARALCPMEADPQLG